MCGRCVVVNLPEPGGDQPLCSDRCQERFYANDIHDARKIIGEYVQGHLGRNLRRALHQKMRRAHPHLERAEGMLSCLAFVCLPAWFTTGLFWVTQTIGILPPGKGGFDTEMKKTGRVSNAFRVQLKRAETA